MQFNKAPLNKLFVVLGNGRMERQEKHKLSIMKTIYAPRAKKAVRTKHPEAGTNSWPLFM
jgi:hypothetical protein